MSYGRSWYEGYDAGQADAVAERESREDRNRPVRPDWGFYVFIVGYVLFFAAVVFVVGRMAA